MRHGTFTYLTWMLCLAGLGVASPSSTQSSSSSPSARIRAANEQLLNQGHLDRLGDFFSNDYVNHSFGEQRGLGSIRDFVEALRTAFPDLRVEVEILLEQGDTVAWRRTHRGTFERDLLGIQATGREEVWHSVALSRVEDGRIVEEWGLSDLAEQVSR